MTKDFKEIKYIKCEDCINLNLDMMYAGDSNTLNNLDYDLESIINTEAPITYNILKERLRECFNIKKISGKALDVILEHLKKFGYAETDNLFDKTIWADGIKDINFIRVGYQRQIYDIPREEISNVMLKYIDEGYIGDDLYHMILKYFSYEVLTEKAREYLNFVFKKLK